MRLPGDFGTLAKIIPRPYSHGQNIMYPMKTKVQRIIANDDRIKDKYSSQIYQNKTIIEKNWKINSAN